MNVKVQYMAQLRALRGRAEETVELADESTLANLLSELADIGGTEVSPHLLAADGQIRPSLLLVLNGGAVSATQAADARLKSGDVVMLLPPIAGG